MIDFERLTKKYRKTRRKRGFLFSATFIFGFAVRDAINSILILFRRKVNKKYTKGHILFIEPVKQGYGDLFFQTSLFESLHKNGYSVSILTTKQHGQVLENNPFVKKFFNWNISDLSSIIVSKHIIVSLGRDTLRETLLCLASLKSDIVFLDKDLPYFRKVFSKNPNTIAWNILCERNFHLRDRVPTPKIFFSKTESQYIKNEKTRNKIGIIAGVEKKSKRFDNMWKIINQIPTEKDILLMGRGCFSYPEKEHVHNLVNKTSYRKNLVDMAACKIVVGTEGSLVHIASSLISKTVVIDKYGQFNKNSHPELLQKVKILSSEKDEKTIREVLRLLD